QREEEGLKPVDVRDRVVDGAIVRNGVRPAIWKRQKGIATGVGEPRSDAAEQIALDAVLERCARLRRAVFIDPTARADPDQIDGAVRWRGGSARWGQCRVENTSPHSRHVQSLLEHGNEISADSRTSVLLSNDRLFAISVRRLRVALDARGENDPRE